MKRPVKLAIDRLLERVPGAMIVGILGEQDHDQVDFGGRTGAPGALGAVDWEGIYREIVDRYQDDMWEDFARYGVDPQVEGQQEAFLAELKRRIVQ